MKGMDPETRERLLEQTKQTVAGKLNPPIRVMRSIDAVPPMSLRANRALLRMKPAS